LCVGGLWTRGLLKTGGNLVSSFACELQMSASALDILVDILFGRFDSAKMLFCVHMIKPGVQDILAGFFGV
jgi:hypothetical protein